jgi:hypothetical protein
MHSTAEKRSSRKPGFRCVLGGFPNPGFGGK